MKKDIVLHISVLIFLLTSAGCREEIFTSNEDDGTIPRPGHLFVANQHEEEIFVVDLETDVVVDVVNGIPGKITSMVSSKNGEKLYVTSIGSAGTIAYSYEYTGAVLDVLTYSTSHYYFSPQGAVMILSYIDNYNRAAVGFVDQARDNIEYVDTLDIKYNVSAAQKLVFHPYEKYLYTVNRDRKIIKYDYENYRVENVYNSMTDPLYIGISSLGDKLFSTGAGVIDLSTDQNIGMLPANVKGHFVYSGFSNELFVTDLTGKYNGLNPTGKIEVYNADTFTKTNEISTVDFVDYLTYTDEIVIAERNTIKAYVAGWKDVFVMDLEKKNVVNTINFNKEIYPTTLTIGRYWRF